MAASLLEPLECDALEKGELSDGFKVPCRNKLDQLMTTCSESIRVRRSVFPFKWLSSTPRVAALECVSVATGMHVEECDSLLRSLELLAFSPLVVPVLYLLLITGSTYLDGNGYIADLPLTYLFPTLLAAFYVIEIFVAFPVVLQSSLLVDMVGNGALLTACDYIRRQCVAEATDDFDNYVSMLQDEATLSESYDTSVGRDIADELRFWIRELARSDSEPVAKWKKGVQAAGRKIKCGVHSLILPLLVVFAWDARLLWLLWTGQLSGVLPFDIYVGDLLNIRWDGRDELLVSLLLHFLLAVWFTITERRAVRISKAIPLFKRVILTDGVKELNSVWYTEVQCSLKPYFTAPERKKHRRRRSMR